MAASKFHTSVLCVAKLSKFYGLLFVLLMSFGMMLLVETPKSSSMLWSSSLFVLFLP